MSCIGTWYIGTLVYWYMRVHAFLVVCARVFVACEWVNVDVEWCWLLRLCWSWLNCENLALPDPCCVRLTQWSWWNSSTQTDTFTSKTCLHGLTLTHARLANFIDGSVWSYCWTVKGAIHCWKLNPVVISCHQWQRRTAERDNAYSTVCPTVCLCVCGQDSWSWLWTDLEETSRSTACCTRTKWIISESQSDCTSAVRSVTLNLANFS